MGPAPRCCSAPCSWPAPPGRNRQRPTDPIPADWKPIPDDEILVITLEGGRPVVIRLAARLAPAHVANIRALANAHWWDGASVYRVQEGFVAQWGDPTEQKPLPSGVIETPAAEFEIGAFDAAQRLTRSDAYSTASGFTADGWPIATNGTTAWLPHCYGAVGVARSASPDTGSGRLVHGHRPGAAPPRPQLARWWAASLSACNSSLPCRAAAARRGSIPMRASARRSSRRGWPASCRRQNAPRFEYRATDNPRFAATLRLRETPATPSNVGGVDVCDVPMALRPGAIDAQAEW